MIVKVHNLCTLRQNYLKTNQSYHQHHYYHHHHRQHRRNSSNRRRLVHILRLYHLKVRNHFLLWCRRGCFYRRLLQKYYIKSMSNKKNSPVM